MPQATPARRDWIDRLQSFDRRWIFLLMGLAIVGPLVHPCNIPLPPTSPMVQSLYDTIEKLHEGDAVYVSVDLDPASLPELKPFFDAVVVHLKRKGVKMAFGTLWYTGPQLVQQWIREVVEPHVAVTGEDGYEGPPDRVYEKNVDYAWLGFREGKTVVINKLASDLWGTYDGRTADGTPLDQVPMMKGRRQLKDFNLVILIAAGSPGAKEFVQQVQTRYHIPMVASVTSVSTTDVSPYYQTGQLLGLSGGMLASAEYEHLVGRKGLGQLAADVLNVGHLVVILAIVFGNVIYFTGRRRRRG
jgi:hypothetical protein